ncbi:MAG: ATP-binding cassette domain-containing protein [Brevinematales bacterium]|nr:ATP-binding cassette domain-containing protein [Brevinematales bacterium]
MFGPTEAGKATVLEAMVGLVFPQSGKVYIEGKNLSKFSQKQMLDFHKNCGFVFQNAALISNLSIYENLSLYYNYHTNMKEKEIYEIANYYLKQFNFDNDLSLRPASLSIGEKMIVNIVRAISHDPDYLFFDNPFASLDITNQRKVKKLIFEMKEKDKTVVVVTNDSKTLFEIADKIAILEEGVIIERGSKDEIVNTKNPRVKEILSS